MSKSKLAKMLPQTSHEIHNGGIYLQKKRCGKPNCKCVQGEKHLAFYFFTRVSGKLIKTYVRQSELEKYDRLVGEAWERRFYWRETLKRSHELIKRSRQQLRDQNSLLKSRKEEFTRKGK